MIKKYLFLGGVLLSTTMAQARGQLGIQIAPDICFNRTYADPPDKDFTSSGASLRFKLGAIYDYLPLRDNCYVSTGLFYSTQQISVSNTNLSPSVQETHELAYLQVPLLLKFYTSEFILDTRFYAKLGFIGQLRVKARNSNLEQNQSEALLEVFRRWGVAGSLGIGVEYDIGLSTSLFAGINYQPGLANVVNKQNQNFNTSRVMSYSDLLSINLGAIF